MSNRKELDQICKLVQKNLEDYKKKCMEKGLEYMWDHAFDINLNTTVADFIQGSIEDTKLVDTFRNLKVSDLLSSIVNYMKVTKVCGTRDFELLEEINSYCEFVNKDIFV